MTRRQFMKYCPVCGKEIEAVYDTVVDCPHCGHKLVFPHWKWGLLFLGVLILVVLVGALLGRILH